MLTGQNGILTCKYTNRNSRSKREGTNGYNGMAIRKITKWTRCHIK